MRKLFGTDGIRGKANTYPITPEVALQLGKAIALHFGSKGRASASAVIGKDTRLSGYMLETALTSGLVSMGMDVLEVGPMPTPAIAHLIKSFGADCGIMITASHNPAEDNGIKVFGADGFKLPDDVEAMIEEKVLGDEIISAHIGTDLIGKAYRIDDARGRYIEFAKGSIKNHSLKKLRVVLDCANGAAYSIAPRIFKELGAEVIPVAVTPDGYNINDKCGATHPERISSMVTENKADVGISLDGDADRVILLDHTGKVVNGDRILAMCAIDFKKRKILAEDSVAVTVMTNLGFNAAMKKAGIKVEQTAVGDRYVIERMQEKGLNLGGEQSGHIIFMDYATTGDGILTALHVLKLLNIAQKPLAELADCMDEYPQKLSNFKVKEKVPIEKVPALRDKIAECERELGEGGRALIRYSGTENLMRVMIEARNPADVEKWTAVIGDAVRQHLC